MAIPNRRRTTSADEKLSKYCQLLVKVVRCRAITSCGPYPFVVLNLHLQEGGFLLEEWLGLLLGLPDYYWTVLWRMLQHILSTQQSSCRDSSRPCS